MRLSREFKMPFCPLEKSPSKGSGGGARRLLPSQHIHVTIHTPIAMASAVANLSAEQSSLGKPSIGRIPRPKFSWRFTTPASRCRKMLLLSARHFENCREQHMGEKHMGDCFHKPGSNLRMASLCSSSDTFDMSTGLSATKAPDTHCQKSVTKYVYYIKSLYRGLFRTQAPQSAECSTPR